MLKQILYYLSVVECHSFTEAAEHCYISQSAISQQLRALENSLGVRLLDRHGRGFSITPAGQYFYNEGKKLLRDADRLRQETRRLARRDKGLLNIGCLSGCSGQELALAVAEFATLCPESDIAVLRGTHEELFTMLQSGQADLVLSDPRRSFSDEYFNFPVFSGIFCIECSLTFLPNNVESVSAHDLSAFSCIVVASSSQRQIEEEFYRQVLGFTGSFVFADSLEEARMLAMGGKGFLPILDTPENLAQMNGRLRHIPMQVNGAPMERSYYAFLPKRCDSEAIRRFANLLRKHYQQGSR